jgi:MFS transporter, DHA1 family, inner membrane transport protein
MAIDRAQRALLALSLGAFGIATGEFVTLGLLPNVAGSFDVTIPQAGHLISAYALGVVVGGPLFTLLALRWSRKRFLLMLALALAAGNVASGAIGSFEGLLVVRFLAGLPHAAYFGAAAVAAGNLVEAGRRNRAMAVVLTGFTLANVVGVPLTTLIGQQAGWRMVFMLVGVIELIAALGILVLVPYQAENTDGAGRGVAAELRAFRNVQVWLALGIAAIGGGAMFSTFSYITPMMTRLAGYSESAMTPLLVLLGIGMTVGNTVGARMSNSGLMRTIYVSLGAQVVMAVVFFFTVHDKIAAAVTIVLFPFTTSLMLPPLQSRIIALAGGAPNLASASIHSAFNVANSLGAWLGGLTIAAGLGYGSPNLVSAGLALLGLMFALVSMGLGPRVAPRRLDFFTDEEKMQLRELTASASLPRLIPPLPVWPAGVNETPVEFDLRVFREM